MVSVLIIEDESPLQQVMLETLELNGYDVYGATNGYDGLYLAQQHKPDIILCDIMMSDMDGYEVLHQVRSNKDTSKLPFVFLTAKTDWASIRKGMDMGADDYLLKPFNAAQLFKAIELRIDRIRKVEDQANEALNETKDQLAQAIARDLKAPLKSVHSTVEHITNSIDSLSPDELQHLLANVNEGATQLTRMTEQITYYVQVRSGLLSKDKITRGNRTESLSTILKSAIDRARIFVYNAQDTPIHFDPDGTPIEIQCFREVLIHGFAEILTNAMLATNADKPVTITVQPDDKQVCIQIQDYGAGIDIAQTQLSFDDIEKLNTMQLQKQGIGVGLALAGAIIQCHDGQMEIESGQDGTFVTIHLPIH